MKATYKKHILNFKQASGTSRGVLTIKETWFIILQHNSKIGIGECGLLKGLSIDDVPEYEQKLQWVCKYIHLGFEVLWEQLIHFPSIQFGLETAFISLNSSSVFELFSSDFTKGKSGIQINGLVWMGDESFMQKQIKEKIKQEFTCVKMKIGAINFEQELQILKSIRNNYSEKEIELRVDANGAFSPQEALEKLNKLSEYNIHSIEQPIAVNQLEIMAELCIKSPIDIALDEELIGVFSISEKEKLLTQVKPQYIILKPSLIGGFKGTQEWISIAEKLNIGWWITSALESNIGLNAIAQWTYTLNSSLPQGLGTGSLYTNNIKCPLEVTKGHLWYLNNVGWEIDSLL